MVCGSASLRLRFIFSVLSVGFVVSMGVRRRRDDGAGIDDQHDGLAAHPPDGNSASW
jgi:hypothetical protein